LGSSRILLHLIEDLLHHWVIENTLDLGILLGALENFLGILILI